VHIVTVNEYLAQRDSEWMGPVFRFLGMSVGVIKNAQSSEEKRAAYACEHHLRHEQRVSASIICAITLRTGSRTALQRGLAYAVVDEVDSILIDEARTPLIISGPAEEEHRALPAHQ